MTLVARLLTVTAFGLLAGGTLACQPSGPEARKTEAALTAAAPAAADLSAPALEELQNAAYTGVAEAGDSFTLANGRWEGAPYDAGGASRPSVTLLRDVRLVGDLDGDGREEAVVLLAGASGGTGETSYVAVVRRGPGGVENAATVPVGDRVQVRDARIDGRRIVLDVVQGGENDAGCCPGDLVTRTWDFASGALREGTPASAGRLSLETMAGSEWVLRSWSRDETAPATPEVTLRLDGARLVGSAGCNAYFANAQAGGSPGDVTVGPVGTTRKMCADTEMAVERRFTQQLAGVRRIGFMSGRLALSYQNADESFGAMLFERRAR